jgi:hypothetical protein
MIEYNRLSLVKVVAKNSPLRCPFKWNEIPSKRVSYYLLLSNQLFTKNIIDSITCLFYSLKKNGYLHFNKGIRLSLIRFIIPLIRFIIRYSY